MGVVVGHECGHECGYLVLGVGESVGIGYGNWVLALACGWVSMLNTNTHAHSQCQFPMPNVHAHIQHPCPKPKSNTSIQCELLKPEYLMSKGSHQCAQGHWVWSWAWQWVSGMVIGIKCDLSSLKCPPPNAFGPYHLMSKGPHQCGLGCGYRCQAWYSALKCPPANVLGIVLGNGCDLFVLRCLHPLMSKGPYHDYGHRALSWALGVTFLHLNAHHLVMGIRHGHWHQAWSWVSGMTFLHLNVPTT